MPVYEFYCPHCHTIFNFLSKRINITDTPLCPKCSSPDMERKVSIFSVISSSNKETSEEDEGDPITKMLSQIDETKLEKAIATLSAEAERIDEEDPKAMAGILKKLFDSAGLKLSEPMEEALKRMEAGEDPEKVEEEMGELLEDEEAIFALKNKKISKLLPPKEDETLYEMERYLP